LISITEPLTSRIEIHPFESVTLTDKQFLTGAQEGTQVRIAGELRFPVATGKIPAVLLVHGSAGVGANVDQWAHEINGIGAATFLLDSFTGRGIAQTITDQSRLGHLSMILDAYRALHLLSKHPQIDRSRIAVMGFSKGGFVALYSSLERFQRMHGSAGPQFAAHIAFYPACHTVFLEDEKVSERPLRLFHGAADNYVSIDPCRRYVSRLRCAGKDVQLTEYPGAHHAFDNPLYSPARYVADAVTTSACFLEERSEGELVNVETGQPFQWTDPCVNRGATLGFDRSATAHATEAVKQFLVDRFELQF
jgi:dienelactone hydrolase